MSKKEWSGHCYELKHQKVHWTVDLRKHQLRGQTELHLVSALEFHSSLFSFFFEKKNVLYIYTSICKIKRECINIVRRVRPSYTTEALFCVPPGGRQTSIATSTKTMMIRTCAHSTFHVLPPPSPSHSSPTTKPATQLFKAT